MSIERAEQLKRELTDKWVVVAEATPELRRFAEFTGKVKTVNMNCRALVEFDGSEDISWYDIDPAFLTVVDGPRPQKKKAASAAKPAAKAAPASKPAAGGGSPLDAIRASGAGGTAKPAAGGGSPLDKIRASAASSAAAAPKKESAGKPAGGSPLDQIRAAAGGAAVPATPATEDAEESAAPEPMVAPQAGKSAVPGPGQSPLDLIRAQNAAKQSE